MLATEDKSTKATKETRKFRMHPKLLMDVIRRQAGTLSKAILEGEMNAIDAGASTFRVTIDQNCMTLQDDGKGFGSRENILKWFEVFGQPHDESEGKVFAEFRMGRGQLFSFGVNEWKSGSWRLAVDIENKGDDYDLSELDEDVTGCTVHVKFYEKLSPSDLAETIEQFTQWSKYVHQLDVIVNNQQVNVDPKNEKWDHVIPEGYIRLRGNSDLNIYNMGIHVMSFSGNKFGTGGDVVSTGKLKVNFARNDIQHHCPTWKKLKPLIDRWATDSNTSKKTLDDAGRSRLCHKFTRGELDLDYKNLYELKLITAVTGRHYSISSFIRAAGAPCFCEALPRGDKVGDYLMRADLAFVVTNETLFRFRVDTVEELLDLVVEQINATPNIGRHITENLPPVRSVEELYKKDSTSYVLLDPDDVRPTERIWLRLLQCNIGNMYTLLNSRKVQMGLSNIADGWTDGDTYIAINRDWLAKQQFDISGITEVFLLMYHETCHMSQSTDSHDHDQEFYERFHDLCMKQLGTDVKRALTWLPRYLKTAGKKLTKKQLYAMDKLHDLEEAQSAFNEKLFKAKAGLK